MAESGGPGSEMSEISEVPEPRADPVRERPDFARVLGALALLLGSLTTLVRSVTDLATAAIVVVVLVTVWFLAWRTSE